VRTAPTRDVPTRTTGLGASRVAAPPRDPADRSAASRQAILSAARTLFSTNGYAATSVSDIVSEAGTSVGLPYYHFGNKKSIFLTLWQEYQQSQHARTDRAVSEARKAGETGGALMLASIRAYLEGAWANRDILPMVHGPDRPPGFDETMASGAEDWHRQMHSLLAQYDRVTIKTAISMISGGLSAVCVDLSNCTNDLEAGRVIDDALLLAAALLEGLPPR
jgi:AcrR family transcriptional regulator